MLMTVRPVGHHFTAVSFCEVTKVSPMQSAQRYRIRAERVRRLAEDVSDQDLRYQLDIIAEDYEELARSTPSRFGYESDTAG
jgi:hypothetical protein